MPFFGFLIFKANTYRFLGAVDNVSNLLGAVLHDCLSRIIDVLASSHQIDGAYSQWKIIAQN